LSSLPSQRFSCFSSCIFTSASFSTPASKRCWQSAARRPPARLKRAEAKAAEYEEKLRTARSEIYKEQEEQRKKWRDGQTAELAGAREKTEALLKEAKASLTAQTVEAKAALAAESDSLAEQIAKSVLAGRKN
jgi:F-type H+-transporting ATPase subunit b